MNPMNALVATGQTTGIEHAVELDESLLQDLGWTGFYAGIQVRIRDELDRTRRVRSLLPVWDDPGLNPDAIPDYTIKSAPPRGNKKPFQIPLQSRLVSVLISSEFQVSTSQFGDPGVALHLGLADRPHERVVPEVHQRYDHSERP